MVGADFERAKRAVSAPPSHMLPRSVSPCAAHHQGAYTSAHILSRDRADDEEKVGRKAVHERRNDADPGIHPTIGSISHMETMAKKTKAAGVFIILTICPAVF